MSAHDVFYKIWRFVRIPLAVVVVLLVGLTIYRFPYALEQRRAEEVVEFIRAQKITLNDVNGVNLPLAPDPAEVDATVEGVDANKNWIRDDVELAIFERYPNDARIRAAMLQYAMGLQLELTQVFNSETWVVAIQQTSRGYGCVYNNAGDNPIIFTMQKTEEIEKLVLNTDQRNSQYEKIEKFQRSFSILPGQDCDVRFDELDA